MKNREEKEGAGKPLKSVLRKCEICGFFDCTHSVLGRIPSKLKWDWYARKPKRLCTYCSDNSSDLSIMFSRATKRVDPIGDLVALASELSSEDWKAQYTKSDLGQQQMDIDKKLLAYIPIADSETLARFTLWGIKRMALEVGGEVVKKNSSADLRGLFGDEKFPRAVRKLYARRFEGSMPPSFIDWSFIPEKKEGADASVQVSQFLTPPLRRWGNPLFTPFSYGESNQRFELTLKQAEKKIKRGLQERLSKAERTCLAAKPQEWIFDALRPIENSIHAEHAEQLIDRMYAEHEFSSPREASRTRREVVEELKREKIPPGASLKMLKQKLLNAIYAIFPSPQRKQRRSRDAVGKPRRRKK